MSRTRAHLHFKQALLLINEQLSYISLNVSNTEGCRVPPNAAPGGGVAPQSVEFYRQLATWSKYMFVCFHFFNSYAYFSDIFFPPTINLISHPSSRSVPPRSPPPSSSRNERGSAEKRRGSAKTRRQNQMHFNSF